MVDTDTKFCSGHTTSTSASNGSLDTVTISTTAIVGELKLDGTNIWIIPFAGGSGTAPVPIATSLVPTAVTWAAGYVTLTFAAAHGYTAGDWIGVGSIGGSENINGYCGTFQIFDVPQSTTLRYAVAADPGTATFTYGKVVKYYKCSQTQTKTATTGTGWDANIVSFTTTADHKFVTGNIVVVTGASPTGYNGTFTILSTPTSTTFTAALGSSPGAWSSGGTITKTVDSIYLGAWTNFTSGPTTATIPTVGWMKVKRLLNGPFISGTALTIQGGTTPAATPISAERRGWIEVVGGELSTTPATYTIPRLGKFTVTGDWFYPVSLPCTLATGTAWASNVTTYTTSAAHGITVGSLVTIEGTNPVGYDGTYTVVTVPTTTTFTVAQLSDPGTWVSGGFGYAELRTNGVAQQTIQLPASGGTTVGTTSYAGVWVETGVGTGVYDFFVNAANMTATASMFGANAVQGKVCYMGAAGLLRFGGDGTNAWGYLPAAGCRIRIGNVISINATKVATYGVSTQTVPNATLTSRPKFLTTGAGVINIDKWMSSWYPIFQQPYSVNITNSAQCESLLISEVASPFTLDNFNTGMSVVASSNQSFAFSASLCFAPGNSISNCHFGKFHNGTSGYYISVLSDIYNLTETNNDYVLLTTTTTGGGTARSATSGAMSLTRVANSSFTNGRYSGGKVLFVTCSDLTFTNSIYRDCNNSTTTTTTGQSIFSFTANSSNIMIDGISFGGIANVHPYNGLIDVLTAANNIKLRNVGTPQAPLSFGSANAMGVILTGAAGGGCYNIEMKRIFGTLLRTGHVTSVDNSYSNITYESVWGGAGLTFTEIGLNAKTKGMGATNATVGQTSVYGHSWQDYFTPVGATLATGTAWASNVTTYTTSAAHNLVAGDVVTISGVLASVYNSTGGYNGTYTVLASGLTSTVFNVNQLTNPGTWTSGGTTNPLLGKIVLQMNEQTVATPSYTIDKFDTGSGFTSVGTLAMLNLDDTITWETPYYILGHKRFTNGTATPWVVAQPTFTSTNPNNHNWYYQIDKGAGYGGVWKNLHFKGSRGTASWAITGTTTCTLTPVTASFTGSIANDILTVTAVSSGYIYEGMTLTGTGVTAGTVVTEVTDSGTGKAGLYKVKIMTVSGGTYTLGTSTQTVASTTITGSTSVYGINVGDNVFDLTTAGNVATDTLVSSISSLTAFVLNKAGTNSTTQVLAFSSIHGETGISSSIGFKLKVRCRINAASTTNSLTTVAIPTVTDSTYQQVQYPLDLLPITLSNVIVGSRYRVDNVTTGYSYVTDGTASTSEVTGTFPVSVGNTLRIRVRKTSTSPKYQEFETLSVVTSTGVSVYVSQVLDSIVA